MDDTSLSVRLTALAGLGLAFLSLEPALGGALSLLLAAGVGVVLPLLVAVPVRAHNQILGLAALVLVVASALEGAAWSSFAAALALSGLVVNQSHDVFAAPATAVGLLVSVVFGTSPPFTVLAGVALVAVLLLGEHTASPVLARLRQLGATSRSGLSWLPVSVAAVAGALVLGLAVEPSFPTVDIEPPITWAAGQPGGPATNTHPGLNGRLDAGDSLTLDEDIVLRVKADQPLYWRGTTYDAYDGRFWRDFSPASPVRMPEGGVRLGAELTAPNAREVRQVFTATKAGLDVIVGADRMTEVYFESTDARWGVDDNSILLDQPLQAGAQWTVVSSVLPVTADQLRASDRNVGGVPDHILEAYAVEDDLSSATADLARQITGDAPTTYDKVIALEEWFDANVEYSREVPDAPGGIDPVDRLLFEIRQGYCEQISTSMIVMLRSLGIPARMAVGFVPGELDESTGEWISRGTDAHAWTEVYFPGIGWQAFDPTSGVPLAGDELGATEGAPDAANLSLETLALVVAGLGAVAAAGVGLSSTLERRRRSGPPGLRRLNEIGARLRIEWSSDRTLRGRLADLETVGVDGDVIGRVRSALEAEAFDVGQPNQASIDGALDDLAAAVEVRRAELLSSAGRSV